MKRTLLAAALFLFTLAAYAQNPIIRDQFTADPTARVFDGKVYLYPSHDIRDPRPNPGRPNWFCMADYHVFSSENLMDWTDHGVIVSQENVPWGNPEGYSMWAPDCVYKDGKYYFFFPNAPKKGFGFAVGMAVADKPEGPFTPCAEPVKGVMGIDPCVLLDDDGKAYIYWSGMGLRVAQLSDDMTSVVGESVRLDENLPAGFKEGPFAFKRNGIYYLTYPWVQDKTETLAYSTSDSPLGPFKFQGLIMEQSPVGCWTNHHSLVEFEGQWYLFYHHNDYSPDFDKNRSARIDKVIFNEDGSIQPVAPTLRGVGVMSAFSKIEIDRYSQLYPLASYIDFIDPANPFAGWYVHLGRPGATLRYNSVDFGERLASQLVMRVRTAEGARVQVKNAEEQFTETAVSDIAPCADWTEVTFAVTTPLAGMQDLVIAVGKGSVEIDWIEFK